MRPRAAVGSTWPLGETAINHVLHPFMSRFIAPLALLLLVLSPLGIGMNLLESLERQFIFFPTPEIDRTPADVGLQYDDVYYPTGDGLTLNGWFIPGPKQTKLDAGATGQQTLLWFHGNGGNISHRVDDLALFHHLLSVNIFIFDYRGYGLSEGQPSEQGVYRDARAVLAYLEARPEVDANRIVFFGRSLGTAVATELAASAPPNGMVLFSPFTSISDLAATLYPFSPLRILTGKRFDSMDRIKDYHGPLLVIHGERDEIIPVELGEKLFSAANEPKGFLLLPDAQHNDGLANAGQEMWQTLEVFLGSLPESGGH